MLAVNHLSHMRLTALKEKPMYQVPRGRLIEVRMIFFLKVLRRAGAETLALAGAIRLLFFSPGIPL